MAIHRGKVLAFSVFATAEKSVNISVVTSWL
nr:MAG TPA: hypothetical protein [Caudoviricetes sp.]